MDGAPQGSRPGYIPEGSRFRRAMVVNQNILPHSNAIFPFSFH
jgi:hypothetical protein